MIPTPQDVNRMFHLGLRSVQFFTWMCRQCTLCFRNDVRLENQLANDEKSLDPMTLHKSQLLLKTLDCLRRDGVIFTKDVIAQYKLVLTNLNVLQAQHSRLCNAFSKGWGDIHKRCDGTVQTSFNQPQCTPSTAFSAMQCFWQIFISINSPL